MAKCYFHYRKFGKADRNPKDGALEKVLIMQLAKLGDMVCTTPVFRAFKEKYPNAKLFVLGDMVNKELLTNNADVSGYLVWSRDFKEMQRILKFEKFDFALLPGPSPEALALLYLSDIPHIAAPRLEGGDSPLNTRAYRYLTRFVDTRPHIVGNYAPREYLRLLETIGIQTDNTKKYLSFSQFGREKACDFFEKSGVKVGKDFVVGLFPSTGYKIKLWSQEKFAALAQWLYEKYDAKIVLLGTETDRIEIEEFLSFVPSDVKIINAFTKFNVDELKAAISMMSLFISVDSGPIYIAEAFGVPTVDIVGPMNDMDQPPRGPKNRIVKADRKKPAITVLNTRHIDLKEVKRQSEAITVKMVVAEIEDLLKTVK